MSYQQIKKTSVVVLTEFSSGVFKNYSTEMGFEPTYAERFELAVQCLNQSATLYYQMSFKGKINRTKKNLKQRCFAKVKKTYQNKPLIDQK